MTEFQKLVEQHVGWLNCDEIDYLDVQDWLTEDIVKLIQLMDAELQRRYDEEQTIRQECYEAFQTDLFDVAEDDSRYAGGDDW